MQTNILLCGVGGQGIILTSKLLAATAMEHDIPVMSAETIGMAQKGGSVFSFLRMGDGMYCPMFAEKGVEPPKQVTFRTMSTRWGVCTPSTGKLTFNYNLFEAPEELIAYVVVHELAHFLEANHSERFWAHVADIMPDYKIRRKTLREY